MQAVQLGRHLPLYSEHIHFAYVLHSRHSVCHMHNYYLAVTLTTATGLMVEFIILQNPYSELLSSVYSFLFMLQSILLVLFFYYT